MDIKALKKSFVSENYKWIVGLVVAFAVAPWGFLVNQWLTAEQPVTRELFFLNIEDSGLLEMAVDTPKATCWNSVTSSNRIDAFRCAVGEDRDSAPSVDIYDPCFLVTTSENLICPSSPNEILAVLEFATNNRDFEELQVQQATPWFIVLRNGEECKFSYGGASALVDGRIDYRCSGEKGKILSLPLDKSTSSWTIRCSNAAFTHLDTCEVAEVWY